MRGGALEVHASGVTFMDSVALALLAHLPHQHEVGLVDPPEAVSFLLETTNLVEPVDVVFTSERPVASA